MATHDPTVLERYLTAGSFRTRFLEAGTPDAPPLLLLHDGAFGGCSSVTWGRVIPALAQHFHVLAPDLLGFGGTDKAVILGVSPYDFRVRHLEAFLEAMRIQSPIQIVGNSFGGSLALRLAATSELALNSVTSISGTGGPWRTDLSIQRLGNWDGSQHDLSLIVDLLIDDSDEFERHVQDRFFWANDVGHYRALLAPGLAVPTPIRKSPPDDGWPRALSQVDCPLLLVAGSRDKLLEPDWTARIHAAAPEVTVETLDAKHSPNIDQPDVLLESLLPFLLRHQDRH